LPDASRDASGRALKIGLQRHAARGDTTYDAIVEERLKSTPAGRFADPHECGELIAFLCGANAGYITGQNIVNVKAPYRLIRLALPALEQAGNGRIINVASTDAKRYREGGSVAYTMTKHAVLALSYAAKFAGWAKGVRVTALCPGAVDTELVAPIPGVTPAANRIAPETIAAIVSFLLSLPDNASVAELVMNTRPQEHDLR